MKIGVGGGKSEFTSALRKALRQRLPKEEWLDWLSGAPAPAGDLEVLISVGAVTAEMLSSQKQLRLVQTASDGYDAVDLQAATEQGIWVAYTPGDRSGNADSVAEFAVMALIAANRHVGQALRSLNDPKEPRPMLTASLIGKTVCIYGFGDIGARVASRLQPFGATITAINRRPEKVSGEIRAFSVDQRDEALRAADAVVLCVRGSAENRHLANAAFFAAMKPGSTLVNIARGSLVDEAALLDAIQSGHLGAAALDVQEHEPLPQDSPLRQHAQIFVTPHIAGFTSHTLEGTVTYLVEVVEGLRSGTLPRALVNQPASPRLPRQPNA